jgi:ABC-type uncharacterized transport system substrate-binding protein
MLSWTDALSGALISYGPSSFDIHWRAGGYVAKILNGAKLGELPVEQQDSEGAGPDDPTVGAAAG